MATKFKKGDAVRQVLPAPVEGVIERFVFNQETGEVGVIVKTEDGQERSFTEDQVESVEE
jgi:hypothetical protein